MEIEPTKKNYKKNEQKKTVKKKRTKEKNSSQTMQQYTPINQQAAQWFAMTTFTTIASITLVTMFFFCYVVHPDWSLEEIFQLFMIGISVSILCSFASYSFLRNAPQYYDTPNDKMRITELIQILEAQFGPEWKKVLFSFAFLAGIILLLIVIIGQKCVVIIHEKWLMFYISTIVLLVSFVLFTFGILYANMHGVDKMNNSSMLVFGNSRGVPISRKSGLMKACGTFMFILFICVPCGIAFITRRH
jgi:hypothetical protein